MVMRSEAHQHITIGISMTADTLFGENDVPVSIKEYQELIQLRKEVEKLKRENYGLKQTIRNLERDLYRRERWSH